MAASLRSDEQGPALFITTASTAPTDGRKIVTVTGPSKFG
jgi:hypothetical protein